VSTFVRYELASDNTAAWSPEAREAMLAADSGFAASYGDDRWTSRAADAIRSLFETDCDVFFVFNGTAANSLALASLCEPYHSVICHEVAHIETDECGAPEFFSNGSKLWLAGGAGGRVDPAAVRDLASKRSDIHFPKPRVLSLTQSTELGTVYGLDALAELASVAHEVGLRIHMDGARFANAVASLGCAPADTSWRAGVDVLSFGGTKNGMGMSEAVVFFDRELSEEFAYRCKQAAQLASKMRYLTAPWATMLEDGSWLTHARHANAMARRLADRLVARDVAIAHPVEANSVFARLDEHRRGALHDAGWALYEFIGGGTRFVCSWQTSVADIDALLADLP
jgi:threonine aldolase